MDETVDNGRIHSMKAARLHGPRDMRVDDGLSAAEPAPGEALIRVRAVGVCGSDVHFYVDGRIGDTPAPFPYILGHEFSGEIAALGPGVSEPPVGTRVAVDPAVPCERCEVCLDGNPNCCPSTRFPGSPPVQGALCEWYAHPAHLCVPLPANLDFADGAMLEPLGIGIHATTLAELKPGDSVAIIGAGPIGLLALQLALASGVRAAYVSEPVSERRELATQLGATTVCDPQVDDPAAWLLEQTQGRGVDVAVEAAWGQEAVEQAVQMARPGGKVVVVGIPREDVTSFPNSPARSKGLTILMSRRMKSVHSRAIALVERGVVDLRALVTHRFPLERAGEAFELMASLQDGVCKPMIEI
jgi:L-iditol 2-dehydrogenase